MTRKLVRSVVTAVSICWLHSGIVAAQSTGNGSIGGVVGDTSGAIMPGVTVEVASPALIEKVRAAATDGDGNYRIVDLRPGRYSVTFTLPGFTTVRREGVEVSTGFAASVNAEMMVGSVEETVTVVIAAPTVVVQKLTHATGAQGGGAGRPAHRDEELLPDWGHDSRGVNGHDERRRRR